jgi:hypothetical protein
MGQVHARAICRCKRQFYLVVVFRYCLAFAIHCLPVAVPFALVNLFQHQRLLTGIQLYASTFEDELPGAKKVVRQRLVERTASLIMQLQFPIGAFDDSRLRKTGNNKKQETNNPGAFRNFHRYYLVFYGLPDTKLFKSADCKQHSSHDTTGIYRISEQTRTAKIIRSLHAKNVETAVKDG